ncbi:MAG: HmuY family protein [Myxococcota bacterium]
MTLRYHAFRPQIWLGLLACISGGACVEDLSPTPDDSDTEDTDADTDTDTDTDTVEDGNLVLEGPGPDGEVHADIDSTDGAGWVYLDMATPEETDENGLWSLKFQRYTLAVNGGVSGDADVQAVFVEGLAYDDAKVAPDTGWNADRPDEDEDGTPEYVMGEWYDYDPSTHVLSPKPGTWFVRGVGGQTYAVEVLDYYSDAGDSGHPSLRYRPVQDPSQ